MSLTKRWIDELIEEGELCPYCLCPEKHDREECEARWSDETQGFPE